MREEFEKLSHILELMQYVICFDGLKYVSENQRTADYLNGAWYAFQEQQKKIDKLSCNHLWIGKSENQYCSKCGEVD